MSETLILSDIPNAQRESSIQCEEHMTHRVSGAISQEFVHELRQPLGVIESLAFYLQLISSDEKVCTHLGQIQEMVMQANRILEHASKFDTKRHIA